METLKVMLGMMVQSFPQTIWGELYLHGCEAMEAHGAHFTTLPAAQALAELKSMITVHAHFLPRRVDKADSKPHQEYVAESERQWLASVLREARRIEDEENRQFALAEVREAFNKFCTLEPIQAQRIADWIVSESSDPAERQRRWRAVQTFREWFHSQ
jgi:hypothetical protein